MESIDEIKQEPEVEVKEEPPDEEEEDTFRVQTCMYCRFTTSQDSMTNVILNEEQLKIWSESLGVNLEYKKSHWICKFHFKFTDFTEKGILRVTAIPFKTQTSNHASKRRWTVDDSTEDASVSRLPRISVRKCVYCFLTKTYPNMTLIRADTFKLDHWKRVNNIRIDGTDVPSICKSHFKNEDFTPRGDLKYNAVLKLNKSQPQLDNDESTSENSVKTCIYCLSNNVYADLLNIDLDKEVLDRWGVDIGVKIKPGQIMKNLWICKSHFDSRDVTRTGKLSKYAVPVDDPTKYIMGQCVYCKSKKHHLSLIRVPEDEKVVSRWNAAFGVEISYAEVAMNPWVCKSHFNPEDIERSAVLKPRAIPVDIAPERNVKKCEYCHSTKHCSFLLNIKMNQERVERWNDAVGIFFINVDNIWMCKTHFNPWDISATGELKTDAIPIDGVPISDVRVCVYCKSRKSAPEFAKIIMERDPFDTWIKASGFELSYNEIIENNWICKSHFHSHDILPSGTLKAHALPIEATEEKRFEVCVWCLSEQNYRKMTFIGYKPKQMPCWEREDGTKVEFEDIAKNPFVCVSHFKPDDFTKTGRLKSGSIPRDSIDTGPTVYVETKCVHCGAIKDRPYFAKIVIRRTVFEKWRKTAGYTMDYDEVVENPWICRSHFGSWDVTRKSTLRPEAIPIDAKSGSPIVMCMCCKSFEESAKMTVLNMNAIRLAKWMRDAGIDDYEVIERPYVCKSHFKPEDFTQYGKLKYDSIPNLKQDEYVPMSRIDDEEVEDLLDAAIQNQPNEGEAIKNQPDDEEKEDDVVGPNVFIPELQDHTYAKLIFVVPPKEEQVIR